MAENAIDLSNVAGPRGLGGLGGADLIGAVAAESNEELAAGLDEDFRQMTAAQGRILVRLGEFDRRQGFRDEGATSVEAWTTERFGVSAPTARALAHVGEVAWNLPHLVGALCEGALSFDKVRALADVATPESDAPLCEQANACTVRELADIARTTAEREAAERQAAGRCARARSEHDRRYLRFNDTFRTVTAQLPAESYAEAKACLEAVAREIPSEDESPRQRTPRWARHAGTSASVTPSRKSSARVPPAPRTGRRRPARSSSWPTWRSAPWSKSQGRPASWRVSSSTMG